MRIFIATLLLMLSALLLLVLRFGGAGRRGGGCSCGRDHERTAGKGDAVAGGEGCGTVHEKCCQAMGGEQRCSKP